MGRRVRGEEELREGGEKCLRGREKSEKKERERKIEGYSAWRRVGKREKEEERETNPHGII